MRQTEGHERVSDEPILIKRLDQRPLRISDGVNAASLRLPPLGNAKSAIESWEIFRSLQNNGVVRAETRFQVSLPTLTVESVAYVVADSQAAFEPVPTSRVTVLLPNVAAVALRKRAQSHC